MMRSARDVERRTKTTNEPAGIEKRGPRCRSMDRAWRIVRLFRTPIGVLMKMVEDQIGKILIRVLRSSTCSTVHSLHGFAMDPFEYMSPSLFSAALFRKLHHKAFD